MKQSNSLRSTDGSGSYSFSSLLTDKVTAHIVYFRLSYWSNSSLSEFYARWASFKSEWNRCFKKQEDTRKRPWKKKRLFDINFPQLRPPEVRSRARTTTRTRTHAVPVPISTEFYSLSLLFSPIFAWIFVTFGRRSHCTLSPSTSALINCSRLRIWEFCPLSTSLNQNFHMQTLRSSNLRIVVHLVEFLTGGWISGHIYVGNTH